MLFKSLIINMLLIIFMCFLLKLRLISKSYTKQVDVLNGDAEEHGDKDLGQY